MNSHERRRQRGRHAEHLDAVAQHGGGLQHDQHAERGDHSGQSGRLPHRAQHHEVGQCADDGADHHRQEDGDERRELVHHA